MMLSLCSLKICWVFFWEAGLLERICDIDTELKTSVTWELEAFDTPRKDFLVKYETSPVKWLNFRKWHIFAEA